jgi:uncharacterized protein
MVGAPEGTPSHWLVSFAVADTDAVITAAEQHEGHPLGSSFETPYGRMAAIADPAGAVFMIIQPVDTAQPARSG